MNKGWGGGVGASGRRAVGVKMFEKISALWGEPSVHSTCLEQSSTLR